MTRRGSSRKVLWLSKPTTSNTLVLVPNSMGVTCNMGTRTPPATGSSGSLSGSWMSLNLTMNVWRMELKCTHDSSSLEPWTPKQTL